MGNIHNTFGCKDKDGTVFIFDGGNDSVIEKDSICYYIYKMNFGNIEKYKSVYFNDCFNRYEELKSGGWVNLTSEELSSCVCLLRSTLKGQNSSGNSTAVGEQK